MQKKVMANLKFISPPHAQNTNTRILKVLLLVERRNMKLLSEFHIGPKQISSGTKKNEKAEKYKYSINILAFCAIQRGT